MKNMLKKIFAVIAIFGVTAVLLAGGILMLIYASGGSLWLVPAMAGLLGIAGREVAGKL